MLRFRTRPRTIESKIIDWAHNSDRDNIYIYMCYVERESMSIASHLRMQLVNTYTWFLMDRLFVGEAELLFWMSHFGVIIYTEMYGFGLV